VETHRSIAVAVWNCDKSHPAKFPSGRANFCIQSEPALVLDGVCTQPFHDCSRCFGIESDSFLASSLYSSGQPEDVVNAAGPKQGIVREVTFPAASMMNSKLSDFRWLDHVDDAAIKDTA